MEVTISSRNTEVSEQLESVTREKIGRLDRLLEGLERANVHFSEERNPRISEKEVCEVNLEGRGHHVRCKVQARDGFVAVDRAVAKLEKQLRKVKTKSVNHKHGGTKHAPTVPLYTPEQARRIPLAEREPAVVKVKEFEINAMSAQEAIFHLDLVDHDFYVFVNVDTGRPAVLYRRSDGDFGLINAEA